MQTITIDFIVPQGWHELSDKQLRYVYQLLAQNFTSDEVKTLCLLHWTGTKVIGKQNGDGYLLRKGKILFEITPLTIAELLPHLAWLGEMSAKPMRPVKLKHRPGIAADFSEVPFESFIICDNLYQGYLQTQSDDLLDELASVLYPGIKTPLAPWERIAVFYWFTSLKTSLANRYSDFFQPADTVATGNLLGSPSMNVEEAMNAQIRALTKGDVTKEAEVLALDTHRALTELNAQAREYKELNQQLNKK